MGSCTSQQTQNSHVRKGGKRNKFSESIESTRCPTDSKACSICKGVYGEDTTDEQKDQHHLSCIIFNNSSENKRPKAIKQRSEPELTSTTSSVEHPDLVSKSLRPFFGVLADGKIHFENFSAVSPSCRTANEISLLPLIRSLVPMLQGRIHGNTKRLCLKRFQELSSYPPHQFSLLRTLSYSEKLSWFYSQLNSIRVPWTEDWLVIEVNRNLILNHTFIHFKALKSQDFHKEIQFQFEGEETQDAGGVGREWNSELAKEIFSSEETRWFSLCETESVSFEISKKTNFEDAEQFFKFLGQWVAKAIFDRYSLGVQITIPILKFVLGKPVEFGDLRFVDESLHASLSWIKDNSLEGIIEETFVISELGPNGVEEFELVPGGKEIAVTEENKNEYCNKMAERRMFGKSTRCLEVFRDAILEIIPFTILSVFTPQELQNMVQGQCTICPAEWKKFTVYITPSDENEKVVQWFWEVVEEMTPEERGHLLQFSTGTGHLPPKGFRGLVSTRGEKQPFCLQTKEFESFCPWPKAHTCFNRLTLPKYESKELLVRYLKEVDRIGFGLVE